MNTTRIILAIAAILSMAACCADDSDVDGAKYDVEYAVYNVDCRTCGDLFAPYTHAKIACSSDEVDLMEPARECACGADSGPLPGCPDIVCDPSQAPTDAATLHEMSLQCWNSMQASCTDVLYDCIGAKP